MIQPLWRTVWRFLKKLGIKLLYDPPIPLLGVFPEETVIKKDRCTPVFIAALFTIARIWKQPRFLLVDELIKKLWNCKKNAQCDTCKLFYLGQYEDCRPGDSSKKLFQRGRGKGECICDFGEVGSACC